MLIVATIHVQHDLSFCSTLVNANQEWQKYGYSWKVICYLCRQVQITVMTF